MTTATWRVSCRACGRTAYRRWRTTPQGWEPATHRPCPACAAAPPERDWIAGQAPSRLAGVIYLLHLVPPRRPDAATAARIAAFHARHYVGKTTDVAGRLAAHRDGQGARVLAAAVALGFTVRLVRTWPDRDGRLEVSFKQRRAAFCRSSRTGRRRGARRSLRPYCPLCDARAAAHRPVSGQWLVGMPRRGRPAPVV